MNSIRISSTYPRYLRVLCAIGLGLVAVLQTTAAASVDPVTLVSKAEAIALLGQPVTAVTPSSEQVDEDTGGKLIYCALRTEKSALVVSVVSFSSAKEALAKMTKQHAVERMEGDNAKITEEKGLGDQAFWATTDLGAEYIVIKGSRVLGLALGGKLPNPPASYREALRKIVISAVAKL